MIFYENIEKIRRAAENAGREITLIAASKTQPKEIIDEFMSYAPDFILGENRVQELREKYDPAYRWHLIGQLQTNKVKYIIDKVELIHSLDRAELAEEIEKQAAKIDKVQDCLIEINTGAELTKGGVKPDDLPAFAESLGKFGHIRIRGIMSVMPNLGGSPELDALYDNLYSLFEKLKSANGGNIDVEYLSAGMTNDYETALRHGANMLRLGRVLFGERSIPAET